LSQASYFSACLRLALDTTSISLRDAIFGEVASNILIHREYMNAYPAKLIIENGQVRTENSNKPQALAY
jgi:ATP-dependent DNA helicase RecG